MNNNPTSQDLVNYEKEWHCHFSAATKYVLIIACLLMFFMAAKMFSISKGVSFFITIMTTTLCLAGFYEVTKYTPVKFTPNYINVNGKNIDISQLTLLKFVQYIKNRGAKGGNYAT